MPRKNGLGAMLPSRAPALFILLLSVVALPALGSGVYGAETVIIDLRYRAATELLPVAESVVSDEGRVTVHAPTNSLVITGSPESIERVREVLARLDRPVQPVRVRVRFEKKSLAEDRSVSGRARKSGDDWEITAGGRREDGVNVRLEDQIRRRTRRAEQVLTVMPGTEAYISVARDLPVTDRWHRLCRRYRRGCADPGFHRMETGLQVVPRITEDHAVLRVTPLVSHSGGDFRSATFTEAATTVTVPLNRWVHLGGMDQAHNEVFQAVLETGRSRNDEQMTLWVRVETVP